MGAGSSKERDTISVRSVAAGSSVPTQQGTRPRGQVDVGAPNGGLAPAGIQRQAVVWQDAPEKPKVDSYEEEEDIDYSSDDDDDDDYANKILDRIMKKNNEEYQASEPSRQPVVVTSSAPPSTSVENKGGDSGVGKSTSNNLLPPNQGNNASGRTSASSGTTSRRAASARQQTHQDEQAVSVNEELLKRFVTASGEEYMLHCADDNKYYYVDWDTQEWKLLPNELLEGGKFVAQEVGEHSGAGGSHTEQQKAAALEDSARSGVFEHPKHGQFLTHIFEMKVNVMCFLDQQSGEWIRMPPAWELRLPSVQRRLANIKRMLPRWQDDMDILMCLRAMCYNTDNVISDYLAADVYGCLDAREVLSTSNDAGAKDAVKGNEPAEEKPFETMTRMIQALQESLEKRVSDLAAVSQESGRLKERISFLQLEVDNSRKEVDRLQAENINFRVELETLHHDSQSLKNQLSQTRKQLEASEDQVNELRKQAMPSSHLLLQQQQLLAVAGRAKASGPSVSPKLVKDMHVSTRSMKSNARSLRQVIVREFAGLSALMHKASSHLQVIRHRATNFDVELDKMRALYMREFTQRKQLFNQIQEMRGNIRVFCRCRRDDRAATALTFPSDNELQLTTQQGHVKKFEFEKVFGPASTQVEVFQDTLPIITSSVDGYNVCLMAYGQTGAGKTYTMMGTDKDPGINIRALAELLRICKERKQLSYTLKVSMLEVYNETLIDLLRDPNQSPPTGKLVIQRKGKGICVPGLSEIPVSTVQDIQYLMETGSQHRTVAMTAMNTSSSRSHLMLKLQVDGIDSVSKATTHGSLMLLDLAGSERISKSEATGKRLVEAAAINKSLSALGQVFNALRQSSLHVPYRNSKLTHLLQPALGGDSKACMFVNVSPRGDNIVETVSTLQFGAAARQVALGEAKQNVS